MQYAETILDLIGNTPLVKLNRMADSRMATVLAKLEQYNPAGSVKDRMAWNMVRRAEEAGLLAPGATLVESTSGNTGLGLAMTAALRGYRCICTMPDKMSKEKIDMLKAYGAEVIITRTDLHHDHPESYVEVAKRVASETPGGFYTDQYYNMDNPEAHYLTTGPELWEQTDGQIDALVGGIGTGGTISGAAKYLREKAAEAGRSLFVSCPDPIGSMYYDAFNEREIREPGIYRVEGIGHDFMVDPGLLGHRRGDRGIGQGFVRCRARTGPSRGHLRGRLGRYRGARRTRCRPPPGPRQGCCRDHPRFR